MKNATINKRKRDGFVAVAMALLAAGAASCAPRPPYRAPLPAPIRAPVITPAPPLPPPAEPPSPQETTRKGLPPDAKIKEQDLPTRGGSPVLVLKPDIQEPPLSVSPAVPAQPPLAPAPLPDDSSLLAKISPGTSPQRAVSLRLTEEGRKLLDSGNAAKALPRLERAIAIDSANGYGYFFLAKAHHQLGRYKESLNFLDVAETRLVGEPFWLAEVYALRGENFRAFGMTERAEASFTKALSINSGNRTASEAMSRLHGETAASPR